MRSPIAISSAHSKYVGGAAGVLNEVKESRRVVTRVAELLTAAGVSVRVFHDDESKSQGANLNRIVNWHNAQQRALDVSVHFNAFKTTSAPRGTEVLYTTQSKLAGEVSKAMADAGGLINRGGKKRTNLSFLNRTRKPSLLLEVCFVDSRADADAYRKNFEAICRAIAQSTSGATTTTPPGPPPQPGQRPTLRRGASGADVRYLQEQLNSDFGAGLSVDGDFGARTEAAVRGYQASRNLGADGIVGPRTWAALETNAPPYVPPGLPAPLDDDDQDAIIEIAMKSRIAGYNWPGRGRAPAGYVQGFALAFANVYRKLLVVHAPAVEMAKADTRNVDVDALAWYASEFQQLGMRNNVSGPDTLRHLYTLMMGLGMRESSGKHCSGRDTSAANTTSETAEAGLFQTSWNAHTSHPTFVQLFNEYAGGGASDNPQGFLATFRNGVTCPTSSWQSHGSGNGRKFQDMCKNLPAFAIETAALVLRNRRKHYGPINRREAEIRQDANAMLADVQRYIDETEPGAII